MASLSRIRNITDKHPVLTGFCLVLVALAVLRVLLIIVVVRYAARITPYDFPGSVWESEEPFVHLEVSETPGDGINGFLVENGNIEKMADALVRLIEDDNKRHTFAKNAIQNVKRFQMDRIAEQWRELFENVIQN